VLQKLVNKDNSILYGIISGLGLLLFYISIVSFFQGVDFAFLNLRSLWFLIFPLAIGFGTQIGLYFSIKHTAMLTGTVAGTSGISAGSMVACCSHFLLNVIPLAGFSGLAIFAMKYQPAFLSFGILSNFLGVGLMLKHKRKMKLNFGGSCCD
jgi:Cu+-exporting ATPase